MKPILSIILPCYNVAPYLDRCFKSIYSQNFEYPFEVIAVNDASTDDTLQLLEYYCTQYKNLRIINHQQNQKLTGARTSGMRAAQGAYIMHLDPDDYLLPNSLSSIFENYDYWDILIANIIVETLNGNKLRYNLSERIYNLNNSSDRKVIFQAVATGTCFAKIIKASLLKSLYYFDFNYNLGEDRAFNVEVFSKATTIKFINKPIYYYCFNSTSLDRDKKIKLDILDWDNSWVRNIKLLYQHNLLSPEAKEVTRKEIERFSIGLLLKIRNADNPEELFKLWKNYFLNQIEIFKNKQKIYKLIFKINSFKISLPLYLLIPMNIDAIKSKIRTII